MKYAQASGIFLPCCLSKHLPFVENVVIVSVFRFFFLCKDFHNTVNEVTIRLNRSVPTEIVGWNLLNIKDKKVSHKKGRDK